MILATIVPNDYYMSFEAVKCWLNVGYKKIWWQGSTLSNNRNQVFRQAQELSESLLFIDSDILFKKEDVETMEVLLEQYDIVTGIYCLTFPPYNATIFKRAGNDYEFMEVPKELTEVGACGGGFLGISKHAMEVLGESPFSNQWEGLVQHGEDVSFCHYARSKGLKVYCEPKIKVGQIRTEVFYPHV